MQTRIVLLALLSGAATPAAGQVPTSAAVMRVEPATQRQRDQGRLVILQDELVAEAVALSDARKRAQVEPRLGQELSERVGRHRQNISALARELAIAEKQAGVVNAKSAALPPVAQPQRLTEESLLTRPMAPAKPQPSVADERRNDSGSLRAPDWLIPAAPVVGSK
jgi:hypothetical protein